MQQCCYLYESCDHQWIMDIGTDYSVMVNKQQGEQWEVCSWMTEIDIKITVWWFVQYVPMFRQLFTKLYCITSQKTNLHIHFVITPSPHCCSLCWPSILPFHRLSLFSSSCRTLWRGGGDAYFVGRILFLPCVLYSNRYDLVHTTVFCIYWIITKMLRVYNIFMFCSV